jgi:NADH-quinone oxidoreductase subunit J
MIFASGILFLIKITTKAGANVWQNATEPLPADNVMTIGKLLMTEYVLPFEVVSVILLAAMIGAIVLARGEAS